jgi:polyisoprenoid-binding protein YceI
MIDPVQYVELDPQCATLVLKTFRRGVASTVGHDLTLQVGAWKAEIEVVPAPAASTVRATVQTGSITVAGSSGGVTPLTAGNRRDIEKTLRKQLGSDRHPEAVFVSTGVSANDGQVDLAGTLTLSGVTVPVQLTVRETAPEQFLVTGSVRQTDFGITPYSALFGALQVRDEVELELEVEVGVDLSVL